MASRFWVARWIGCIALAALACMSGPLLNDPPAAAVQKVDMPMWDLADHTRRPMHGSRSMIE